jgi:hypothetical protein
MAIGGPQGYAYSLTVVTLKQFLACTVSHRECGDWWVAAQLIP